MLNWQHYPPPHPSNRQPGRKERRSWLAASPEKSKSGRILEDFGYKQAKLATKILLIGFFLMEILPIGCWLGCRRLAFCRLEFCWLDFYWWEFCQLDADWDAVHWLHAEWDSAYWFFFNWEATKRSYSFHKLKQEPNGVRTDRWL